MLQSNNVTSIEKRWVSSLMRVILMVSMLVMVLSSENRVGETSADGLLCISECNTCPSICSPPPTPPSVLHPPPLPSPSIPLATPPPPLLIPLPPPTHPLLTPLPPPPPPLLIPLQPPATHHTPPPFIYFTNPSPPNLPKSKPSQPPPPPPPSPPSSSSSSGAPPPPYKPANNAPPSSPILGPIDYPHPYYYYISDSTSSPLHTSVILVTFVLSLCLLLCR